MQYRTNAHRWLALGVGLVLGTGLLATAGPAAAQTYRSSRYRVSQDYDRDGIPNWRDSNPRRYDRYRVRGWRNSTRVYTRAQDIDRDGIPNWSDRDRDGDGRLNVRDRYPNDRRRR
jgi:hypothetical protein